VGLLEVTVDNLALPAAADQQADGPRAKWVGRLTFRLRAPTAAVPVVHSGDTLWLRPFGLTERREVCWQSPPARFRYGRIMDLSTTQRGTALTSAHAADTALTAEFSQCFHNGFPMAVSIFHPPQEAL
jgi:hypothetical protein